MFWTFLFTIPIIYVSHKFINDYYQNDLKQITMKYGWNTLELCSHWEIYFSNIYKKIKYYIPVFFNKPQPIITFISNGEEIVKYSLSEFIKIQRNGKIILKYDFVLYELPIVTNDEYNKYDKYILRYENHNDILHLEYNSSVNTFDFNMIHFTFKETNNTYKIDFGRNNFNMNENILFDTKFLKWYMNINYSITIDDDDKYDITFIDHNMNYITLPNYCYIIIDKMNYKIVNDISNNDLNVTDNLIVQHSDNNSLSNSTTIDENIEAETSKPGAEKEDEEEEKNEEEDDFENIKINETTQDNEIVDGYIKYK